MPLRVVSTLCAGGHLRTTQYSSLTESTGPAAQGPRRGKVKSRPLPPLRWMYCITSTQREGPEAVARFSCALEEFG